MALADAADNDHERCKAPLQTLTGPLVTSWPAFTETMFLLHDIGGWRAQQLLWRQVQSNQLELADIGPLVDRVVGLMDRYHDVPMSLADASLVAIAEAQSIRTVFSLDSDFAIYRYRNREPFHVLP